MSRIEVNGIYKHAPLTNAQMATTKRNLDREVVIMRDAVTDRATLIPPVTDPTTDASAYPTNYIYAMDYDSTDDGGDNPNIRRHIPTLELLGDVGDNTAGSNWINIQTNAIGTYNYLNGGETIQEAFEKIDTQLVSNSLKYIIDSSTDGSITTSTDGVTPTNTNNGGVYQITFGVAHTLDNSSYSSILGGASNIISGTSTYSTIVAGVSNSIRAGSLHGFIGTSVGSYIDDSDYSAIIAGTGNGIDTGSNNSFIGTATGSYINAAQFSAILVGASQTISASEFSIIGAGFSNAITDGSTHSFIGSGYDSYIDSSPYSVITGGYQNYIDGVSDYGVISGGIHNYILDSRSSVIGGGTENYIHPNSSGDSYNNGILAGSQNRVTAVHYVTSGNFIGAGTNNWIKDAAYSSILSGKDNYIYNGPLIESNSCFIGAGTANAIQGSADSAVVSGLNNYVYGSVGSVVVSGLDNYVNACHRSGITFGLGNSVNTSEQSSIVGGHLNQVYYSDKSGILGGYNNRILFSNYSFVGGGSTNYIGTTVECDTYSVIAGGFSNYIDGYNATYSFIGSGELNEITGDHSVIVGGKTNTITGSADYAFIGGGESNTIDIWSEYSFIGGGESNTIHGDHDDATTANHAVIGGGKTNTITGGADYAFIGGGELNVITDGCDYGVIGGGYSNYINGGSSYSVIAGGNNNEITDGSSGSFIGAGQNNTIMDASTYSAILGGSGNTLAEGCTDSFIIGTGIDTTGIHRIDTTFMNNIMLWNRGFELKDKTFNIGDVLMVESDVGGVPYVTWGAAPSTNTYSGLDPIATSAGTYSVKSQGQSIILTSYIAINNAESGSGTGTSTSGMVGTDFTNDGYTFTNYTAISYNTIYGDATGISSQNGLEILDGFAYDIKVKNVNLSWKGPYMKNAPSLAFAYSGGITVTRDGSTRTIEMGDLPTVNVTGTTNAGAYDPSPIYNGYGSSDSADTASPYLFLRYNATTNQVNLGIAQLYIHQKYVYKAYTVYDSVSTDSFFTITWPTGSYALPSIGSTFYFWTSNPATNSSLGSYTVANVVGNDVTVNSNFGNVTNGPCWIFVPGKLPYLTATFDLDITKTAV